MYKINVSAKVRKIVASNVVPFNLGINLIKYSEIVDYPLIECYKDWCKTHVGPNLWNYYGEYKKIPFQFKFKNAEDLLAFKIRFSI